MTENRSYAICSRCVMDTSDPDIVFDENGVCCHCHSRDDLARRYSWPEEERSRRFRSIIEMLRRHGRGCEYDCVIGLSGGVDSSYVAYTLARNGVRCLAVHLDNGWNSELAVSNIHNLVSRLGIDLYTHVIDWNEFKDLQLAFLKASTPDSEIPSDHAIVALMYRFTVEKKIKYLVTGWNYKTETHLPRKWSAGHFDWTYIRAIHDRFGTIPLSTFPHVTQGEILWWRGTGRLSIVDILNYIDYDKQLAMKELEQEVGWRYYGGKHYESVYTRFFQGYILPRKFGFDKRRVHFSSLICSGQMERSEALRELPNPTYPEDLQLADREYAIKKFGLSESEFDDVMNLPPKSYWDYPRNDVNEKWWYKALRAVYRKIGA